MVSALHQYSIGLSQRGDGWWILEDVNPKKPTLLARLKYEGQSQQHLRDLDTFGDKATAAEDFLHQFSSCEASKSDHPLVREGYGGTAQQVISSAAIFQLNRLRS